MQQLDASIAFGGLGAATPALSRPPIAAQPVPPPPPPAAAPQQASVLGLIAAFLTAIFKPKQ
jgi:hypothetical protein